MEKKIFIYKKNLETHFVDFPRLVYIVELINSTSVDVSLQLCHSRKTEGATIRAAQDDIFRRNDKKW